MEAFDVIIVGGGPAGSSCAWKLRQGGVRTLVIDKHRFPRDKPCAGWITPQVVQALALDRNEYSQGRTWQPITGFRCGVIGGATIVVRYGEPISFGIRRCEFDTYLLKRAGGDQRLNEPVQQIERSGERWIINDAYSAPVLIGAGGHFCPVARRLGARKSPASVVVAQEGEFRAPGDASDGSAGDTPTLFFCRDLCGYGWCFRKGEYLNVGLGRTQSDGFSSHVTQFRQHLREHGIADGDGAWKGHAYQLYDGPSPRVFDDGVLLVGDAAGLAYAQSGEGIRPAVESGLLAADVIVKAERCYAPERLATYQTRLQQRLGKPRQQGFTHVLPAAWLHAIAWRLLANHWFSQHVVMDRWFLHRGQAALCV